MESKTQAPVEVPGSFSRKGDFHVGSAADSSNRLLEMPKSLENVKDPEGMILGLPISW